ncbi:uncharacterized protein G2W53_032990 [Senna tora]|uniref:Uncharacterized protein n=1 Tax=Senna tora TaxID=362788 RepID=A0A834WCD1_9FABA|nr:uncharacterized protein G2W53_032990 [Senna tora]
MQHKAIADRIDNPLKKTKSTSYSQAWRTYGIPGVGTLGD